MPYNVKKTYNFKPSFNPQVDLAVIPTVNISPAELEAGGTFFSSIEKGTHTNKISVELSADNLVLPGSSELKVYCSAVPLLVKNKSFTGTGQGTLKIHSVKDTVSELITVTAITSKVFSVTGSVSSYLGSFNIGQIFKSPKFILSILSKEGSFGLGDRFTFNTVPDKETFEIDSVLPADLRNEVNGNSNFIQMPSFSDGPELLSFSETFLSGGGGFPDNPLSVKTGIDRVLVQVNKDGDSEVYRIYEWVGDSPEDGSWQLYS